jgi:diguanylate cyclase (GGDEF)-like protein/PAS domain S-box-containing protein
MFFKRRLNFILPALIAVIALLIVTVSFFVVRSSMLQSATDNVERQVRVELIGIQVSIEQFLKMGRRDAVLNVVSNFSAFPATYAMVMVDGNGKVLASTDYRDIGSSWHDLDYRASPEMIGQITVDRGTRVELDPGRNYVLGYSSICHDQVTKELRPQRCGFVFYQVDLAPTYASAMRSLRYQALMTSGGTILLALMIWGLLYGLLTRRADLLVRTAEAYGRGERGKRINLHGHDELAMIAQAVDGMLEKIEDDERILQSNESRMRAIFDAVTDALIIIDSRGAIVNCNSGFERIFGYGRDEIVRQNVKMLMPDPYQSQHDGYLSQWRNRGFIGDNVLGKGRELHGLRKNGLAFPVEVIVSPVDGHAEQLVVGVVRDITERKLAEEGLQLAQKVFENTTESIIISDHDNRIIKVNQAYVETTGYTQEEVVGANPNITSSGRHDKTFYQAMWKSITEQGMWSGEIWDRRKNGEVFPKWLSVNAIKNQFGRVTHYVGIFTDITNQKQTEQQLELLAYYDPLTNLPNRALFKDRLGQVVTLSNRQRGMAALLFVDLDGFKKVNDTLGHNVGDLLLEAVARRLEGCVRKSDTVARLGGDEFTVILSDVGNDEDVAIIGQKIIDSLQAVFKISGNDVHIGASVGIGLYPRDAEDSDTLIKHADIAMYAAKSSGKGGFKFFNEDLLNVDR